MSEWRGAKRRVRGVSLSYGAALDIDLPHLGIAVIARVVFDPTLFHLRYPALPLLLNPPPTHDEVLINAKLALFGDAGGRYLECTTTGEHRGECRRTRG